MPLKGKTNHGLVGTRVHNAWTRMKSRCNNPKATQYKWYGGRGIKVCERWGSFPNFLADMGIPPTEKHTIDRIDYNGNYEPKNCRWATMLEQQEHKRARNDTVYLTHLGKTMSVTEWGKYLGIPRIRIYARIRNGFPVEEILAVGKFLPWSLKRN